MSETTITEAAPAAAANGAVPHVRIAIAGAGFSGLGMAIRLKREGIEDFVVLERGEAVGGTWAFNSYPGCQCDVPSHLYSFSFALNPGWSRTYSMRDEIWRYLERCTERFEITPHLRLGCALHSASWDERAELWRIETSQGPLTADLMVGAVGPLSEPRIPEIPGLDRFQGAVFHSAEWNHDHDLAGERVAVVGTGASSIQIVPRIQPEVERLHVLQRTPPWLVPHTDRPISGIERRLYATLPPLQRLLRTAIYWGREAIVLALTKPRLNWPLRLLARAHLRRQVRDPELRAKLTPDYKVGCKRILPSNRYYPTLTQPNVELIPSGLAEVRERSVVTADGTEREVDAIVLGTGFHVTDLPAAEQLRGRGGRVLAEVWEGSPQAYLGTTIAGFPNLFFLLGPNTGLGHTSVVLMVEWQIAHVIRCLGALEGSGERTIEVRLEAQAAYNDAVQAEMPGTVWSSGGCASWYLDRNGMNTTLWPQFTWQFRRLAKRFRPEDYAFGEPAGRPEAARTAAAEAPGVGKAPGDAAPDATARSG